ncbi:MAG: DUF1844 domain-containing protein [Planctomycetota bacterium]|nr:DUF1844 domain-containing protein [Planctomycetota bacterium]
MSDTPKIIIDSDWKSQAQAEKDKLQQKVEKEKPVAAPGGAAGAGGAAGPEGEPSPFADLVSMLVTQALMYMGAFPDPRTGQAMVSLEYAKLHIDMLGTLEEKTKGNLSEPEQKLLTRAAGELRMEFVELSKEVERAVAEGRIKRPAGPAGAGGVVGGGGSPLGPGVVSG